MAETRLLGQAVVAALPAARFEDVDPAALDAVLGELWSEAQRQWPGVVLDPELWGAGVAQRISGDGDLFTSLRALETSDLLLALACAEGDDTAATHLSKLVDGLAAGLRRAGAGAAQIDDLLAELKLRLLQPAPDGRITLLQYGARARLARWLRVAAMRDYNATRRQPETLDDSRLAELLVTGSGPELGAFHHAFKVAVADAFRESIRALGDKDRDVLRHHLLERLSVDRIGALYDVHRSTAARWLVSIRDALHTSTRSILCSQLQLSDSEFEAAMQVVLSGLTYSIGSELDERTP